MIRPARAPVRLLIAPQDIRVADPTIASDIYAGHYAFAGRVVNGHGRTPFHIDPPSEGWAEALHGFAWLRHLRAADTALARANGRALVDDWIAAVRPGDRSAAWRPAVVARRLMSWLSQSPTVLEGADTGFYRRLMKSLMQQSAVLQRRLAGGLAGDDRLWASLALAEVALCADRAPATRRAPAAFLEELDRQILPDGGHVSRDPNMIVDLLLDLLPLRQAYAARGAEVPATLLNAIDRMMPMLRLFRHADGSLALFNGMGVCEPEALATILAHDDARAMPLTNASYSGYQRLAAGESVLICDTGRPPPPDFASRAHAGTLSFEFSSAGQMLVVNCGHPATSDSAMTAAARSTAAHSTLVLADTSSGRLYPAGRGSLGLAGALMNGPQDVAVTRSHESNAVSLEASHDGYRAFGFLHQRRMALSSAGTTLVGEDELVPLAGPGEGPTEATFAIRFHLHPQARPSYAENGGGILISGPRGPSWRFFAEGAVVVSIEESIYFGSPEGSRRSEQIILQGTTAETRLTRWSLAAMGG